MLCQTYLFGLMHEQAYFLLAPLSPIRVTSDVDATRLTRLESLTMLLEALGRSLRTRIFDKSAKTGKGNLSCVACPNC